MKKNIVVVDDKDNIIDSKSREIVDKEGLRYRVSALWIKNSKGDILLAKRALTKIHSPGKWGPAVSGTVEEGESYEDNILRESEEELGLNNVKLLIGNKLKHDEKYKYYVQWFLTTIDKPARDFKVQTDEVADIKWFSREELENRLKECPNDFLSSIKEMLNQYH